MILVAPFNEPSEKFINSFNLNFDGYYDNYKKGDKVFCVDDLPEKINTLYIVDTQYYFELLSVFQNKRVGNIWYVVWFNSYYMKTKSRVLYIVIYKTKVAKKKVFLKAYQCWNSLINFLVNFVFKYSKKMHRYIQKVITFLLFIIESKIYILYKSNKNIYALKDKYKNQTCIILGNGPSFKDVDNSVLDRYVTFGSNGIFLKYIPDLYMTISKDFYVNYIDEINELNVKYKFIDKSYQKILDTDTINMRCTRPLYGNILYYNFPVPMAYSVRPDKIVFLGGSVIFAQIQMAQWMGFKKIILLGVDHNMLLDKDKVYGGVKTTQEERSNIHFNDKYISAIHYDIMAIEAAMEMARFYCERSGVTILNATPNSKLDVFEKIDYDDIFEI